MWLEAEKKRCLTPWNNRLEKKKSFNKTNLHQHWNSEHITCCASATFLKLYHLWNTSKYSYESFIHRPRGLKGERMLSRVQGPKMTHKVALRLVWCHNQYASTAAKEASSLGKKRCFLFSLQWSICCSDCLACNFHYCIGEKGNDILALQVRLRHLNNQKLTLCIFAVHDISHHWIKIKKEVDRFNCKLQDIGSMYVKADYGGKIKSC